MSLTEDNATDSIFPVLQEDVLPTLEEGEVQLPVLREPVLQEGVQLPILQEPVLQEGVVQQAFETYDKLVRELEESKTARLGNTVKKFPRLKKKSAQKEVCNECGKVLAAGILYRNHVQRHSRDYKFRCTFLGCDAKYTTRASLNLHKTRSHKPKKYACLRTGCLQRFSLRGDLDQHMRRGHKRVKPAAKV